MTVRIRAALLLLGLGTGLIACGSTTDHTKNAKAVFEDSVFGASYKVEDLVEDPANPGHVGYDLSFEEVPDLRSIRPPTGFNLRCDEMCDARTYEGPEPDADGRCAMVVITTAEATRINVGIDCGPAYGDP